MRPAIRSGAWTRRVAPVANRIILALWGASWRAFLTRIGGALHQEELASIIEDVETAAYRRGYETGCADVARRIREYRASA